MYERFKNSISKPKMVFFYVKDSFGRMFSYILLLTLLLFLPILLTSITNKEVFFPPNSDLESGIENNFLNHSLRVEDGKLIKDNPNLSASFSVENFTYVIGVVPNTKSIYIVSFETSAVVLYTNVSNNLVQIESVSYSEDFEFTISNTKLIRNQIDNLVNNSTLFLTMTLTSYFFIGLTEILLYGLIMALLASVFRKLPLKFREHYKIAIYLLTPWVIFTTLINLFGLQILSFVGIILIYLYHILAYNSIRVIRNPEVKDRDE